MKKNSTQSGFTLIEVMVSVAIFSIIVTIGIGSLLSINTAHKKALANKTALDSVNFVMESIAKSIRTGDYYSCTDYSSATSAVDNFVMSGADGDCSGPSPTIYFNDAERGGRTRYSFNQNTNPQRIDRYRFEENGSSWSGPQSITGPDVSVEHMEFVVRGASLSDGLQPTVTIRVRFRVRIGGQEELIDMQTTVAQRSLDAPPAQQGPQNVLQLMGGVNNVSDAINYLNMVGQPRGSLSNLGSTNVNVLQNLNTSNESPVGDLGTRN